MLAGDHLFGCEVLRECVDQRLMPICRAIRDRGWIWLPIESASHLDEGEQRRLVELCVRGGVQRLEAVLAEELIGVEPRVDVAASSHAIQRWQMCYAHFNVLLCAPELELSLFCTVNDYLFAMGPPAVVESWLGEGAEGAFRRFMEFAHEGVGDEWVDDRLQELGRLCARFMGWPPNGQA